MTGSETMSMMGHLEEFRNRLVKALLAVGVGSLIAFFFNEELLSLLSEPYEIAVPGGTLNYFAVTEAFSVVMRVSLFGGVILASPVVLYQIWRFAAPALTPREKKWAYPITAVFVFLFIFGVVLGYTALERGLSFLLEFGGDSLTPLIGADRYLKFATRFILAFGIAFEFPIFLFVAAAMGVITSKKLRENRRWALLIILVAAALITPSGDPMTLMLMSVPLYVLYELTIVAIRLFLRK